MFILGNFLIALSNVISLILNLLFWMIFIRALLSWVNPDPYNPIVHFLYRTTEPLLEPIRRHLPVMGLDFSPMIVILVIVFLQSFLVVSLRDKGMRLRYSSSVESMPMFDRRSSDGSDTLFYRR